MIKREPVRHRECHVRGCPYFGTIHPPAPSTPPASRLIEHRKFIGDCALAAVVVIFAGVVLALWIRYTHGG